MAGEGDLPTATAWFLPSSLQTAHPSTYPRCSCQTNLKHVQGHITVLTSHLGLPLSSRQNPNRSLIRSQLQFLQLHCSCLLSLPCTSLCTHSSAQTPLRPPVVTHADPPAWNDLLAFLPRHIPTLSMLHLNITFFFFFLRFYLFIHETHTHTQRQRHRQREKQTPCREPDTGLDPRSPGSCPGLKAAPNR